MHVGIPGLILILLILLVLFGPKKLPELGKAFDKRSKNSKIHQKVKKKMKRKIIVKFIEIN